MNLNAPAAADAHPRQRGEIDALRPAGAATSRLSVLIGKAMAGGLCTGFASLGVAATTPAPDFSPPPVSVFQVYRAIDSRLLGGPFGDAGTRLGNTNVGSVGGVLAYLHTEVVPAFASGSGERRRNGIDAIAVFEVRVLNTRRARRSAAPGDAGGTALFGPFMSFDRGAATQPDGRDQLLRYGAYVGVQDQRHSARHAYAADWYSFVGRCPLSPFGLGEGGGRDKPTPCPTAPSLEGICDQATGAPDGSPLCQYTFTYLGYLRLDDLVGITSADKPLCRTGTTPRPCADYADFRGSGHTEYDTGPADGMGCAAGQAPETGLAFWLGRCDPLRNRAREQALMNWTSLVR
ncbi:hypothetical protein [Acidovorax sp. FG27]|uniref:hypothetical protein n=1 Tax=Acidovorax sp. FG27 TaxID=3133652 RepID=UPI00334235E5